MADASSYETVLSAKASAFLVGLSKPKQRRLISLLLQLADNPDQIGDYSEPDDTGGLHYSFWPRTAATEPRLLKTLSAISP